MKDSKRLFLGIRPNQEWLSSLQDFIQKQNAPFHWIQEENFHITLLFIGSFPSQKIAELSGELRKFFASKPMSFIAFDKFTYIPPRRRTMLWAQAKFSEGFEKLEKESLEFLKSFYEKHEIPFNITVHQRSIPHITLARLKNQTPFPLQLNNLKIPEPFQYKKVILYESQTGGEGSKYFILDEFNLNPNIYYEQKISGISSPVGT